MAINEEKLETWSNRGSRVLAKETHEKIRNVLQSDDSLIKGKDFEIYLQGSYKNATNIRGDSDVDIVVQLNSTFTSDTSQLTESQKKAYDDYFVNATYTWDDFRQDVLNTLQNYFGKDKVKQGNKSIKVEGGSGRLPADIIPCLQYRKYRSFSIYNTTDYVEGMKFYTMKDRTPIINYPKIHYANGSAKNQETNELFKRMVRIFKNARSYLVENKGFDKKKAPSYFIENLLYNVPNDHFNGTLQNTMYNILKYLHSADLNTFICQNHQLRLFGPGQDQWNVSDASEYILEMITLWNEWDQ
ncbi:nucleotidyltransferase [Parageobacillus thermoglucosidasius]|uniref:nucleotidyltransferase domain-containing protein n=1 Tax=Parageobacillus thermoglucosidasius TaxID=1426 RepID=UPI003B67B745